MIKATVSGISFMSESTNTPYIPLTASEAAAQKPLTGGNWADWLLLALALISVALLAWESWGPVTPEQSEAIILADYSICGLFFLNFMWRWREEKWALGFVGRNWYDVLGMIPVSDPALRSFRLIRVVILLARMGVAADRVIGEDFTYRLVNRFKQGIVQAISGTVTVAVLNEVADVLVKGTYTQNIARALEENQSELRDMIREKLRDDPQTGRFKRMPYYNEIIEGTTETALRVIEQVLLDPRTDELVADMLRENINQIRLAVAAREANKNQ